MEPEFAMMLSYLQELSSKQKPNYKMLRSQFEVMKERNHVRWNLDWLGKDDEKSSTPRSDSVKPKSPVLNMRHGGINLGSL